MSNDLKKTLAIGSDHAGFELKEHLQKLLKKQGWNVSDKGTHSEESADYPDFAHAVADAIAKGDVDLGIVVCGSGNGVNITANKHEGVRSALAWTPEIAELARQHNHANVLAVPARFIEEKLAEEIVVRFLNTETEGGRHERRVNKIEKLKEEC